MSRFLQALLGCNHEGSPPIWFMRQAGRYMQSYRSLRERHSFLDLCKTPELLAEVTLQPIKRFGFDAAIIFSDILLLLEAFGCTVSYSDMHGPHVEPPDHFLSTTCSWDNALTALQPVYDGIILAKTELKQPLIGFAGAPCTLLSYVLENKHIEQMQVCKKFLYSQPELAQVLIGKFEKAVVQHLSNQVMAGCDALQIFDTWASALPPPYFKTYSIDPISRIVETLSKIHPNIPILVFARGASWQLDELKSTGAHGISLDFMVDIGQARKHLGPKIALQGNLDPTLLLSSPKAFISNAKALLEKMGKDPSFIFGLGHGVLPKTPEAHVEELVEFVRSFG